MAIRVSSVVMVFAVAAFAGCVGSDGPGSAAGGGDVPQELESDKAGVEGTVVDDSLSPVQGAEVAIITKDGPVGTMTDEAGAFRLVNLEPGKHQVLVQKLGYESGGRPVTLAAGEVAEIQITLTPIAVAEPRTEFLIGEGYFSCGAYLVVTSWGNLHACVWDEHKPRYSFEVGLTDFRGVMQEVVWTQSTALTSESLAVRLQYGSPVCDPFCAESNMYADVTGTSPVRVYSDLEGDLDDFDEDPVPLSSLTFPDGDETPVIVFQQRMTHYITIFYGEHGDLDAYSGIPDA
jgi:hypothetical protein